MMAFDHQMLDQAPSIPRHPWRRWWLYQQERFPIFKHGLLILIFTTAAINFSALANGRRAWPDLITLVAGFVSAFLFFLQLRIADECKDFIDDTRYRPYRAVPRGLVSLRALAVLGALAGLVQFGVAFWLDRSLLLLLGMVWGYMFLMGQEFFVRPWLKTHPLIYLLSHMVIMPVFSFYLLAFGWLLSGDRPPDGLVWFLLVSFGNGLVIELGRKIRAPQDEEVGVETYSALWGRRRAVLVWLGALFLAAGTAGRAAIQIDFLIPTSWIMAAALALAIAAAARFMQQPTSRNAGRLELTAGLWTLLVYLCLGLLPLLTANF